MSSFIKSIINVKGSIIIYLQKTLCFWKCRILDKVKALQKHYIEFVKVQFAVFSDTWYTCQLHLTLLQTQMC